MEATFSTLFYPFLPFSTLFYPFLPIILPFSHKRCPSVCKLFRNWDGRRLPATTLRPSQKQQRKRKTGTTIDMARWLALESLLHYLSPAASHRVRASPRRIRGKSRPTSKYMTLTSLKYRLRTASNGYSSASDIFFPPHALVDKVRMTRACSLFQDAIARHLGPPPRLQQYREGQD
jgi:hypothetical protein